MTVTEGEFHLLNSFSKSNTKSKIKASGRGAAPKQAARLFYPHCLPGVNPF
jgi:hypothetical protein